MKSRKMRIYVLTVCLLAMMLFMTVSQGVTANQPTAKEIVVGAVAPMTGPLSIVGLLYVRGFQLFFDKVNEEGGINIGGTKYKFKFIAEDSKLSGEVAGTATRKLIFQDKAKYVWGGVVANEVEAVGDVSEQNGVLHLVTADAPGTKADIGKDKPYTVRLQYNRDDTHTIDFDYLKKTYPNAKTVVIEVGNVMGMKEMVEDMKYVASQRGFDVKSVVWWELGTIDFLPTMTKVMAYKPKVIVAFQSGQAADQWRAARQLGFNGVMIANCPLGAESYLATAPNLTDYICNGLNPNEPTKVMQEIMERWAKKYKEPFISDSTQAWDTGWILVQAMQKAQSVEPEKVVATLESMTKEGSLKTSIGPANMAGAKRFGVNRALDVPIPLTHIMDGKAKLIGYFRGSNR